MMGRKRIDMNYSLSVGKEELLKKNFYESLLTVGNGYICVRGSLEEGGNGIYPGTYIAGIYGGKEGVEIVNLPNPLAIELYVDGKRIDTDFDIVEHRRILNIKHSILLRETIFSRGDWRIRYRSSRFFSLKHRHLGVMQMEITPLDSDVEITLKKYIDTTTRNEQRPIGGPMKHYSMKEFGNGDNYIYVNVRTKGTGYGVNMLVYSPLGRWTYGTDKRGIYMETSENLLKGGTASFVFLIAARTTRESLRPFKENIDDLKSLYVEDIWEMHRKMWRRRWNSSYFSSVDNEITKAVRFDMYHLLIASREDIDASVPAKTYSGEWYKGHIFWDNEIYAFPFFATTQPKIARNLLLYRYRRIDRAREKAHKMGYRGILWPWESADTGKEETPDTWVNFDGTIIPVYTHKREQHIAGDVAYAVDYYYRVTGDEDFMLRYGAEIIFETARFFASRVEERNGKYEIRCVIGPNEFHQCVNNNSYTNYLAKWCLKYAYNLYEKIKSRHPRKLRKLAEKISLREREVDEWPEIADRIVFLMKENGLIEEFEGYFSLEDVVIEEWDENGMPVWPKNVKLEEVHKTQLVKQADVVLLLHLFSEDFDERVKRINLDYYEKRTTHKSSLSVPSYAIINAELGRLDKAYRYFLRVVYTDLKDIYKNTHLGIHAAAMGGVWQIILHGFLGVRFHEDYLKISPSVPEELGNITARFFYRENLIEIVAGEESSLKILKGRGNVGIKYGNDIHLLKKGEVLNL